MIRTLIVGFDGAMLDLCDRFIDEGRMPTVASINARGASGELLSVTPYNSAVAWSSLMTGTSPGRHGVFDFVLPLAGQYGYRVATRRDRRTAALWNRVCNAGGRAAVVNIPMTFPAEPIDGVMVSGMDAPGLEARAVHPSSHLADLRRICPDYRIMSKAASAAAAGAFDTAERELTEVMRSRSRYVQALVRNRDFDLVVVNLEATDGAHHFFWQHHDPSHPRHDPALAATFGDAIGRIYAATDDELSRLIEAYAPDTVVVVSDHGGAGSSDWVVFTNDWLVKAGLLSLRRRTTSSLGQRLYGQAKNRLSVPARRALRPLFGKVLQHAKQAALYGDFEWTTSRAYALMQPAVWLNIRGREPAGIVTQDERDQVVTDVVGAAGELRLADGTKVFGDALPSECVYTGDAPYRPDIVLELAIGMHIRSRNTTGRPGHLQRVGDLGTYMPSGVHSPRGMIAAAGHGIAQRGRVGPGDIHQVTPSVLAIMGIAAPALDGRPFDFVESSTQAVGETPTTAPEQDGGSRDGDLNEQEEAEVLERLRGLGYVD
jgi:predicted AlkP superfamily phosphohydrolase/phosphomutase